MPIALTVPITPASQPYAKACGCRILLGANDAAGVQHLLTYVMCDVLGNALPGSVPQEVLLQQADISAMQVAIALGGANHWRLGMLAALQSNQPQFAGVST
jgi:hypothetical protein